MSEYRKSIEVVMEIDEEEKIDTSKKPNNNKPHYEINQDEDPKHILLAHGQVN